MGCNRRRLRLMDEPARGHLPAAARHSSRLGYGGECPGDGIRQHGADCATGVAFTRNPSTGANEFYGEYLINAQGEDVVAGIRTPQHLTNAGKQANKSALPAMEEVMPEVLTELYGVRRTLEDHYRDMQDIEFTVQRGKLWMLQTRSGKRTAQSALKIAVSLVEEGLITREEAIGRIDPASLDQLLHPTLDPKAKTTVLARGLPASPGAALGEVVFTAEEAEFACLARRGGNPRTYRDEPGRHSRHVRRQGHFDDSRRHDQPRRGRCPRHGTALRRWRGGFAGRLRGAHYHVTKHRRDSGRDHHSRWVNRRGHIGRGADDPARALRRISRS